MARLLFGTVSNVNLEHATADIAITELENMVKTDVPILDTVYRIPAPGETVAALFDDTNGKLQRGVILGRIYCPTNTMDVSAQIMRVKKLEAGSIIYHNSCEKG